MLVKHQKEHRNLLHEGTRTCLPVGRECTKFHEVIFKFYYCIIFKLSNFQIV